MDDDSTPKAGASTMVPVAIGLVGVLLGAAALYFSLANRGAASAISSLKQDLADTTAVAKAAAKQSTDLDGKFAALVETNSSLNTQIQNVASQVNDALNRISAAVNQDHDQIKTLTAATQQLAAKATAPAPSTSTASTASGDKAAPATTTATAGPGGVHVIVANDTFGSLAKKYGVTISAIEAANPDANPNKLHLGQKINIPPAAAAPAAPATPAPAAGAAEPAGTPAAKPASA
jgi:LysM repeat protein